MKTDFFLLLICIFVTDYVYSAESPEWSQDYAWTLNVTGCKCQFDGESKDCACCNPGGCQCPEKYRHQCVQCNHADQCGILPPNYPWTRNTTGCQCYFDSKSWDCACCNPGGCECPEKYRFQCVQCNHGEQCGILPADYPWTHNTTGCKCYFDSASKDCACCNTGGCQCPEENRHQCVQCDHGDQCGTLPPSYPWTYNTTGCKCYFNNESTNCACCVSGGCQCPEENRHQCVQCNHGEQCGTRTFQPPNYPWTYRATGCKCLFDSESTNCACCNIGGSQCPQENRHQCVKRGHDEQCGTLPPNHPWTYNATGCKCYFDTESTICACCNPGGCQCPIEHRHQCVECNHGEECGTLPPNYPWTSSKTGCKCDFDSKSKDCACCNTGGCQCPKENRHQCVQCGHDEQCDKVRPMQSC